MAESFDSEVQFNFHTSRNRSNGQESDLINLEDYHSQTSELPDDMDRSSRQNSQGREEQNRNGSDYSPRSTDPARYRRDFTPEQVGTGRYDSTERKDPVYIPRRDSHERYAGRYRCDNSTERLEPSRYTRRDAPERGAAGGYQQDNSTERVEPSRYTRPDAPGRGAAGLYQQDNSTERVDPSRYTRPDAPERGAAGCYQRDNSTERLGPGRYSRCASPERVEPGCYSRRASLERVGPNYFPRRHDSPERMGLGGHPRFDSPERVGPVRHPRQNFNYNSAEAPRQPVSRRAVSFSLHRQQSPVEARFHQRNGGDDAVYRDTRSMGRASPSYQPHSFSSVDRNRTPTKNIRPESYDGSVPWEEYASHFEDCAELSGWDLHTKVLYLATSLRGSARTYYMSLDQVEKRVYSSLIARMKQRFGGSKHSSTWLTAFENRRRQEGEHIITLSDDLRQLAKKAYSSLDNKAQEQIALNQLYKLVSLDMKCRCMDRDCETVQEAAAVIEKYEAIYGEGEKKKNVRVIDTKGIEPNLSSLLQKLDTRLEKLEHSMSSRQNGSRPMQNTGHQHPKSYPPQRSLRKCYECESTKHLARDCPDRKNGPKNSPSATRKESGPEN